MKSFELAPQIWTRTSKKLPSKSGGTSEPAT